MSEELDDLAMHWPSDKEEQRKQATEALMFVHMRYLRDRLYQMAHDLDAGCECSTCVEILNIAHTYK